MSGLTGEAIALPDWRPREHRAACPACAEAKARPRDDALAVKVEPDGTMTWLCHRCGWRGSMGSWRSRSTRPPAPAAKMVERRPRADALAEAMVAYRHAKPIASGTTAASYFEARGCALPHPNGDLRCLEQHRHPSGHVGAAMLALVTDAVTGKPLTVRRTWISMDDTKAAIERPRLLWSGLPKLGGVVRLWPDDEVTHGLCVGEGIETALTAARGYGLAWAALDAGNLAELPALSGIEALTIVADHDPAGTAAAEACAQRWLAAGAEVTVWTSPTPGADLNDMARAP